MPNLEGLSLLNQGKEVWNHWRKENSAVVMNLSMVDLSKANLNGFNLSMVNLSGADLSSASFVEADLSGTNLSGQSQ